MLNTTSAYFKDQLLEKLQLQLATRELYILRIDRDSQWISTANSTTPVHAITFQVAATQEEWKVEYTSDTNLIDLPRALKLLADDMANTMHDYLTSRLMQVNEPI